MLGDILKHLREERKITQKELAKYLGVSDRSVGYYENGKRTPPPDMLEKIADFYNVSVDYLLGRTYDRKPRRKKSFDSSELVDLLPEEYRELFKEQNLGYIKFAKEMMKEEINPEDLIQLIRFTQNFRKKNPNPPEGQDSVVIKNASNQIIKSNEKKDE